jgi:hypothetical protein
MLHHQLRQNFVLLAQLLFQLLYPLVLVSLGPFTFQRQRCIQKQLFLPAVERTRRQPRLFAYLGDRYSLNQMAAQKLRLFLCAPMSTFILQKSRSNSFFGETSALL